MKILLRNNVSQLVIGGMDYVIDPALISNIRDYMSVDVPGAFHSPQYKKRVWDGKKYYCTPGGKVHTGMVPLLLSYLEDEYSDLEVEIMDERAGKVAYRSDFDPTVGDYSMDNNYDFQMELAKAFNNTINFRGQEIYFPRGIVDAATNAGKTTIIAGIFNNTDTKNMLILIHRKGVYKQLVDFMGGIFGEVGQINDKYYEIKPVTVAMVQTLANRVTAGVKSRVDVKSFDTLVVDECHRSGSKTYKTVLKHSDAYMRVFLSGTALDSDDVVAKLDSMAASGPRLAEVKKTELMDRGISTPVEVRVHLCNTLLFKPTVDYRDIIDECIFYSSQRVHIMRGIIAAASGPLIVAVDKIAHGQFIYEGLTAGLDPEVARNIQFTHGQDPHQIEIVEAFKKGEFQVLIATGILSEGINLPLVREMIYASGGKAKISVKQWMGRIERLHSSKNKAVFHDFYDINRFITKHSEARLKIYRDENLPVLIDFDLKDARRLKPIIIS